jgi:hypothetical protein
MRFAIFVLLVTTSNSVYGQSCVKGDIQYSVATYADEYFIKNKYGRFLDSLLKKPVFEYFRDNSIKNLPHKDKDKRKGLTPSESHVIEPLFIDLATFNGVYAKRVWQLDSTARKSVRFRCGFYHHVFIISDNKYVELSGDTLKNKKLFRTLLGASFSDKEVEKMTEHFKYRTICDHYTFFPSFYIKRDDEVLFDVEKIKDSGE